MKNLFDKIFKKKSQLNYIIAEYHPKDVITETIGLKVTEYDLNEPIDIDEMQIDKIYQCLYQ